MFYLFLAIYVHVGLRLSCIPGSDKSAFVTSMCYWRYYECNGKCYLYNIMLRNSENIVCLCVGDQFSTQY